MAVEAQLYKLLLYEQGSHFSMHRDTEKAEGMWGELWLPLPHALPAVPWLKGRLSMVLWQSCTPRLPVVASHGVRLRPSAVP